MQAGQNNRSRFRDLHPLKLMSVRASNVTKIRNPTHLSKLTGLSLYNGRSKVALGRGATCWFQDQTTMWAVLSQAHSDSGARAFEPGGGGHFQQSKYKGHPARWFKCPSTGGWANWKAGRASGNVGCFVVGGIFEIGSARLF